MKMTLLLACLLLLFGPIWLNGQGCVAIRGNAACGGLTRKLLRIPDVMIGKYLMVSQSFLR
jgi:hypothetical protein